MKRKLQTVERVLPWVIGIALVAALATHLAPSPKEIVVGGGKALAKRAWRAWVTYVFPVTWGSSPTVMEDAKSALAAAGSVAAWLNTWDPDRILAARTIEAGGFNGRGASGRF